MICTSDDPDDFEHLRQFDHHGHCDYHNYNHYSHGGNVLEYRDDNDYNDNDNHCDIDNDNDNHCDQVLFRDGTSDDPDDSEGSGWTIVDGQSLSSSALT